MKAKAILKRQPSTEHQTLGTLEITDGTNTYQCVTLELPWKANAKQVSCIPTGTYTVVPRVSHKYGKHYHVTNVPGRSYILIHAGNFFSDILGCILVGKMHLDINRDGHKDVTSSKLTLKTILEKFPNGFELTIQ